MSASRGLETDEIVEAQKVFGRSLDYSKVIVDASLGLGGRQYVSSNSGFQRLHMGPLFFGTLGGFVWKSQTSRSKVSGVTVRAWRAPQKLEGETETDSDGQYYLGSLRPGAYQLQFYGAGSAPTTSNLTVLHPGQFRQVDCVAGRYAVWRGFANVETRNFELLIHELTHAWQSQHGKSLFGSGIGCQILDVVVGDAYSFDAGEPWGDYNIEQQASIVARWYSFGTHDYGKLWPYIRDYVRKGKTE